MMKLDAPGRDVPSGPGVLRLPPAALLVVAGVPGAGKTTLLSRVDAPGSLVLDPSRSGPGSSASSTPFPTGSGGRWSMPGTACGSCSPRPAAAACSSTTPAPAAGAGGCWPAWPAAAAAPATCCCSTWAPRPPSRASRPAAGPCAGPPSPPTGETGGDSGRAPRPRRPGDPGDPSRLHAEGWASVRLLDRPAADRLVRVVIPGR